MKGVIVGLLALLLGLAWAGPTIAQGESPDPITQDGTMVPGWPVVGEIARVVEVVDGDTIKVDRGQGFESVRYIGIDTPETVHPDELVQPFGPEASLANEELVAGKWVILEPDISDTDKYDRLLRYVWVMTEDGLLLVNHELVAIGLAVSVNYPPDDKYADLLLAAEEDAFRDEVGMWSPESTEG